MTEYSGLRAAPVTIELLIMPWLLMARIFLVDILAFPPACYPYLTIPLRMLIICSFNYFTDNCPYSFFNFLLRFIFVIFCNWEAIWSWFEGSLGIMTSMTPKKFCWMKLRRFLTYWICKWVGLSTSGELV